MTPHQPLTPLELKQLRVIQRLGGDEAAVKWALKRLGGKHLCYGNYNEHYIFLRDNTVMWGHPDNAGASCLAFPETLHIFFTRIQEPQWWT